MLAVTASLCYGGEDVGSGGPWLCLWAKISAGPWMVHSNVIEKIKIISCQNDILKRETRANSHLRSLSQLLFAMEERALAAADHDFVFGPKTRTSC